MKKETFEEYVQSYIDFFKEYKTEDAQLKKLIVTDLQCILKRYKKEKLIFMEALKISNENCYGYQTSEIELEAKALFCIQKAKEQLANENS